MKRRGKSSPLVKQFARHEKPHAVQDKQRKGSRPDKTLGYRRTTANESSPGIRPACGTDEMNDHQREQSRRQNSAYRHRNYEGRFRNRRRPSLFRRQFAKGIAYASFEGCDAARQGEPLKFGIDNEQPKPRNSPNQDLEPAETLFCLGEHPPLSDLQPAPLTARQEENFYEKSVSNHQSSLLN